MRIEDYYLIWDNYSILYTKMHFSNIYIYILTYLYFHRRLTHITGSKNAKVLRFRVKIDTKDIGYVFLIEIRHN